MAVEPGKRAQNAKPDRSEAVMLEAIRKSAEAEVAQAIAIRDLCLSETISTGRWLFASLFAMNGGAAIALLQKAVQNDLKVWAGGFFVAGVVLAMLAGQLTGWLTAAALRPLSSSIRYWSSIAQHGRRYGALEAQQIDATAQVVKKLVWVRVAGYASLLSFVIGCMLTAVGMG